ncbi:MAG: metallophosphoesterase family protein [Candidatus Omnitrophota bacterium]
MRFGVFSDIHANLEALTAILEDLSKRSVDTYVCAGDLVGYGADPSPCIKTVREVDPIIVCGNHDRAACGLLSTENFNAQAREAALWTKRTITSSESEYLTGLEFIREGRGFTLVHGSLVDPEFFEYIVSGFEASATIRRMKNSVCFVAHTHVPGVFYMSDGRARFARDPLITLRPDEKYIVNSGSVGQPRDGNNKAAYAVFDDSAMTVEIRRVRYDIDTAKKKILRAGLPAILAVRLSEGR